MPPIRSAHSFCRICGNTCGVVVDIDDDDRIVAIRGDRQHPLTEGYACTKGLDAGEMHRRSDRILHPLKRRPDGTFEPIALDAALDEIAERVRALVELHGPHSVAGFLGTTGYFNLASSYMFGAWLDALGSRSFFTSHTIDCSNKAVTAGRLGSWSAGKQPWSTADVWMLVGTNPLVSLSMQGGIPPGNPSKQMRRGKEREADLIVIDPRRTETSRHATVFLQPKPGEDATVLAAILRIILEAGLADDAFCEQHVHGLDALRAAVDTFTPERAAARAGVDADELRRAAHLFGGAGKRGCAGGGTGVGMSPHSNLVDHLIETLNVVCGRFRRAGEPVVNGGSVLFPPAPRYAEVAAPARPWEHGYHSRVRGFGTIPTAFTTGGEVPTGILADEILAPGDGQIRCLFVEGGNPALAIPDQPKVAKAFSSLELLVAVEPFMTATAELAHYILPPTLMFERADLPMLFGTETRVQIPFAQYTPPIVSPPAGAEVVDDWAVYLGLARRLGLTIEYCGVTLDRETEYTTDDLLELIVREGQVPFEELVAHPEGRQFDLEPITVQPARPQASGRFDVMPLDVQEELGSYLALGDDGEFTHRLAVRRMRHVMNSLLPAVPEPERGGHVNPAYLHPDDLLALGLEAGDLLHIESDYGHITGVAAADDRLRQGVVSMSHCYGVGLLDEDDPQRGASTNRLVDTDRHYQSINAMPTMSGLRVKLAALAAQPPATK